MLFCVTPHKQDKADIVVIPQADSAADQLAAKAGSHSRCQGCMKAV